MKKFGYIIIALGFLYSMPQGARYLIICPDNFYEEVLPLAEWKTKKGMLAKIATLSETGSSQSQIKAYIQNAYSSWEVPPQYVLLVGDVDQIPFPSNYNDHYYALLDGDQFDDVYVGRLPASNEYQVQVMVSKILHYEEEPYLDDSTWFSKATLIVREDYDQYSDSIYWQNTYYAAQLLVQAGYTHIDTFSLALGNNSQDVINAINSGRTFLMFRGQGVGYWWSPFAIYASNLNNGFKEPLVISITCATLGSGSYMGEDWMRAGSPDNPKGSIAFIGTTTIHCHYASIRSAFAKGIVRAIYDDGLYILGVAFDEARRYMLQEVGMVDDYYGFTLYGDPELNLMTDVPKVPDLTFPNPVLPGSINFVVNVSLDNTPVEGALVLVRLDTLIYSSKYTNSQGEALFYLDLPSSGTLKVFVSGHNLYPTEDSSFILTDGPFISLTSCSFIEESGNGDGLLNPGEEFSLNVEFTNLGNDTAFDVEALLLSNDSSVIIIDSFASLGTLSPNDSTTLENAFRIKIKDNAKDGHSLNLLFKTFDSLGDTWQSGFSEIVYAPRIVVLSYTLFDTLNGNGNGIAEPGEVIEIVPKVANLGHQAVDDAVLKVISSSPNFYVSDAFVELGSLAIGDTVEFNSDPIRGLVPQSVSFEEVEIECEGIGSTPTATHSDTSSIVFVIASTTVPTGPDAYGYYAYDNTDTVSSFAPSFDWFEIAPPGPGNMINEITNEDADTVTVPLPFTFKFYGINYDSIGICSNGFLELGKSTYKFGYNTGIPQVGGPKRMLAPMWCDLDPSEGGDIYEYYDAQNHRWIVEFKGVVRYGGGNPSTFQVILLDPQYYSTPTGDGIIIFQYLDVGNVNDCTVGIEDHTETVGIQYLYNGNYASSAAPIVDGRAIKFTTESPNIISGVMMDPLYVVVDTVSGNGDGSPDWGETFALNLTIYNLGEDSFDNVSLHLHSVDGVATVMDSLSFLGSLYPGDTVTNDFDPFIVQFPNFSLDSVADFNLEITGSGGLDLTYFFGIRVGFNVGISEVVKSGYVNFVGMPYPNPAKGSVKLAFGINKRKRVKVSVYDIAGRKVRVLLNESMGPGVYTIVWDGRDDRKRILPSGVYFIKLDAVDFNRTRKVLLIR